MACQYCGRRTHYKSGKREHERHCSANPNVEYDHECECGETFRSEQHLRSHQVYCDEVELKPVRVS